ncbi:Periplasmic immunogenic protein [Bosea sp. LC85]|uniref:SIMPL domain-containing protein n=1 Tax=Bosea sp. LC85 TaxID=1502851 RepID=UPI0004E3F9C3|nr:SIMPL domain-containing protein [Bosea sp. LC85]KFC70912.1 Periplasmic immunogenic protein [Bosea sp. LC85]
MKKTILLAAMLVLSGPVMAETVTALAPAEGIVIRTEGEVRVRPDIAILQAGIVSEGKTAAEALAQNTPALARLVEAVKAAGIAPGDLMTSQVSLMPRMTQPPVSPGPKPPRAATIDGYEARTGLTVTVRDLAKAGPLIDALAKAGANEMSGISFGLADESKAKDTARLKAAEVARARAELHATALGVKVGELVSIVEAEAEVPGRGAGDVRAFRMAAGAAPISIEPGEITVTSSLRTVWRIAP